MTRVSCIEHPARDPFALLRSDYMQLADGDAAAAMLLSVFEHWTNTRLNNREERGGDLWIFRTLDELVDVDLCGAFGRDRVRKAIKRLFELDFLERRRNPDKGWDRTWQYRLNLEVVQVAIDDLQRRRESGLNTHSRKSDDATSGSSTPAEAPEAPETGAAAQSRESDDGSDSQSRKSDDATSGTAPSNVGNPTSNTTDSVTDSTGTTASAEAVVPYEQLSDFPPAFEPYYRSLHRVAELKAARKLGGKALSARAAFKACADFKDRDLALELDRFVHYWTAGLGQNRRLNDVARGWREWLRSAAPKGAPRGPGRSAASRADSAVVELDRLKTGRGDAIDSTATEAA